MSLNTANPQVNFFYFLNTANPQANFTFPDHCSPQVFPPWLGNDTRLVGGNLPTVIYLNTANPQANFPQKSKSASKFPNIRKQQRTHNES